MSAIGRWIKVNGIVTLLFFIASVCTVDAAGIKLTGKHKTDELLVRFKNAANEKSINAITAKMNARAKINKLTRAPKKSTGSAGNKKSLERMNRWRRIQFPPGIDIEQARARLMKDSNVEVVEYNYQVSIEQTPNDPLYPHQWSLENTAQRGGTIGADTKSSFAWDIGTGQDSVIVAVIDTGINYSHEDLAENMWINPGEIADNHIDDDNNGFVDDIYGYDFANNDADPMDDNRHGTHVAGTIAARGNNALGITGVAWQSRLMALKFLGADGRGWTADAVKAVMYAVENGARILNNSWSGPGYSQALRDAIVAADEAETLFVAAAANENTNNDIEPWYPASYNLDNIISVAATDKNDNRANFSNYGTISVDLGAPGVDILSTIPESFSRCCEAPPGYDYFDGTSMAAPHVSGAAALLLSVFPHMNHRQVKDLLLATVDPTPSLDRITVTGGRLNIAAALNNDDDTPPDAISDLTLDLAGSRFIRLTWSASGDDADQGSASRYDIRYSTSPIKAGNFSDATRATSKLQPSPHGITEVYSVTGLEPQTQYFFAIKVIDNVGNSSDISNVVSASTNLASDPDFVISQLIAPGKAKLDQPFSVSNIVCNIGPDVSPDTVVGFYVSKDNIITASDRLVGERSVPALGSQQCSNVNTSITLPVDLRIGNYYFGAIVDYENRIVELREDNNEYLANLMAIDNYIDLAVLFLNGTQTVAPGSAVEATDNVCNIGNGLTDRSYSALYLSTDPEITTADTLIDTHSNVIASPGGCTSGSYWGEIPVATPGIYFLGSIADYTNLIDEGDEDNNVSATIAINVVDGLSDLTARTVQGPANATLGSSVGVNVELCNEDIKKSGDFSYKLVLSENSIIDENDRTIGTGTSFLYNGQCKVEFLNGLIPDNLDTSKSYLYGVIVDSEATEPESDETNNHVAGNSVTLSAPMADLVITNLSGPVNAAPGEAVTISGTICNTGSGSLPTQFGKVYLSTDQVINQNDLEIGWQYSTNSSDQCTSTINTFATVPTGITPGLYYWGAIVDTIGLVSESDETNNAQSGNSVVIGSQ